MPVPAITCTSTTTTTTTTPRLAMASHVQVVDSSARRTQVKVAPTTYLRDVLEEACAKLKLDPDQFTLKYVVHPAVHPAVA